MVISKDLTLYERNANEELIQQEVELVLDKNDVVNYPEYVGETIELIPMLRGELKEMFGIEGKSTEDAPELAKDGEPIKDSDAELIVKNCKKPQYTINDTKYMKPVFVRSIVRTILSESGVKFDDSIGLKKIDQDKDEFGKNSLESGVKTKKAD